MPYPSPSRVKWAIPFNVYTPLSTSSIFRPLRIFFQSLPSRNWPKFSRPFGNFLSFPHTPLSMTSPISPPFGNFRKVTTRQNFIFRYYTPFGNFLSSPHTPLSTTSPISPPLGNFRKVTTRQNFIFQYFTPFGNFLSFLNTPLSTTSLISPPFRNFW